MPSCPMAVDGLVLPGLSAGSALIPLGAFSEVVNLGIAAVKAMPVLIFFM